MTSCHHPIKDTVRLPVVPVPAGDSRPDVARAESNSTAVESASTPAAEPVSSLTGVVAPAKMSLNQLLLELADAYFDFDQKDLREDARAVLHWDKSILESIAAEAPDTSVVIEGHCDERGSAEYNLALGAIRAEAAKEFLVELGRPAATLQTITYGKERPQCTTQTEDCWQKNRRAHLAPGH
jgi:peptidoglycan-associated lipoprotein